MAITDPQAISFVNSKARPFADMLASCLQTANDLLLLWNSGISATIPNTSAIINDGASVNGTDSTGGDGRTVLTGVDINNLMVRCTEIQRYFDHGTIATGTTNTATFNTILKPAVNVRPLF